MTTPERSWSLTEIAELIEQRLVHGRVVETQHRWDQISAEFRDLGFPRISGVDTEVPDDHV